jgi:hypothetical protein
MNSLKTLGLGILILLVATTVGAAGPDIKGDFKETVKLVTSEYGLQYKAFGYCTVARGGGVEMFGIRVFADLPDGTNLIVSVTNDAGTFDVGTITMFLGSGSLVMYSSLQPSPAFPLSDVDAVAVYDRKDELMSYAWSGPSH